MINNETVEPVAESVDPPGRACPLCHGDGYTREWGTIEDGQAYIEIACWLCHGRGRVGGPTAPQEFIEPPW